jgi:histidyl-tRNA synthetase
MIVNTKTKRVCTMPNIPKGTRDFLPPEQIEREVIIDKIKSVFRRWGFDPIETPTLEFYSTLVGKYGEEEKLIYKFKDYGGRDLGLRYDLTVPLARFFSDYQSEIIKPFKRYQIQPVFRAEKPQKGRYREFYQCDIDIVGSKNWVADVTVILTIDSALKEVGLKNAMFKINDRRILKSLAKNWRAENREIEIARAIDKLEKIGVAGVREQLMGTNLGDEVVDAVINIISTKPSLEQLGEILKDDSFKIARDELLVIFEYLVKFDVNFEFDVSLARGLDYYTGMIFEVKPVEVEIGSIAGGGRYDNLIEAPKGCKIPAVGGSIGIDRLLVVLRELSLTNQRKTWTNILIAFADYDKETINYAFETARKLQKLGYNVDIYSGDKNLKEQLKYANDKGIEITIIIGRNELENRKLSVRFMNQRYQIEIAENEIETMFRSRKNGLFGTFSNSGSLLY